MPFRAKTTMNYTDSGESAPHCQNTHKNIRVKLKFINVWSNTKIENSQIDNLTTFFNSICWLGCLLRIISGTYLQKSTQNVRINNLFQGILLQLTNSETLNLLYKSNNALRNTAIKALIHLSLLGQNLNMDSRFVSTV